MIRFVIFSFIINFMHLEILMMLLGAILKEYYKFRFLLLFQTSLKKRFYG